MSLGARNVGLLKADKATEFRCGTCNARCTRSPTDDTEYGHMIGCPERPDHLPNAGSSGSSYYKPDADRGEKA